ncbi:MAG: PAS domain S-box protein [bacterium]|nr:PAS domain S-box protein [bacterium]
MANKRKAHEGLPLYLIPILIGLFGVLFAQTLTTNPILQIIVVLVSVAAPLFAGGNLLARVYSRGYQRFVLLAGVMMLVVGAMVTVVHLSSGVVDFSEVPEEARNLSKWIGLVSLLTGVFAVMFTVMGREEEIEEISQQLRYLAEQMSEGFVLMKVDGTISLANERFLEMAGLDADEVLNQDSRQLAERMQLSAMLPHIDRRKKGVASEYEITWPRDGRERRFWVSGTPIFNRMGQLAGTLATLRDVTDQHELSQQLEDYAQGLELLVRERTDQLHGSEKRMRNLLLHMNEGFLTVDSRFRIRFANERICGLLQSSEQELLDSDLLEFIDPGSRGRFLQLMDIATAQTGRRAHQELNLVRRRGVPVPALLAVAPVEESAGEAAGFSVVVTDLREQKHMQHQLEVRAGELEDANEELRMLDRAKDGFLTNVSHELRTPLSTIQGYVEMLESGSLGGLDGAQETAVGVMSRNLERLGHLIEEMIEFSRMETRGLVLTRTLFSMAQVVEECVASAKPEIVLKELSTSVHVPDDLPPVWGDRKRIGQVLTILLANAVKFTDSTGMVQIHVARDDQGAVTLAVQDTGIGIDPAYRKKVFDKFFQIDSSLSRRYEGAGIGLSIATSIADAHGGAIRLESVPNEGSTFSLILPGAAFALPSQSAPTPSLDGVPVLLVTEEPVLSAALTQVLQAAGALVTTTDKGYEAVRLAGEDTPALIMVDEVLSDLSGSAIVSRIGQLPQCQDTPLVLFTGSDSPMGFSHAIMDPQTRYLRKPFTAEAAIAEACAACQGEPSPAVQDPVTPFAAVEEDDYPHALVIDADADLLEWIEMALSRRRVECQCATDLSQAIELAERTPPDVIFVDADLPADNGIGPVQILKSSSVTQSVPIYLLAGMGRQTTETGVQGVLRKPFRIKQIADIVFTGE